MESHDCIPSLYWLPAPDGFDAALRSLRDVEGPEERWTRLVGLANRRLDFMQTRRLDRAFEAARDTLPGGMPRMRLAVLGSGTLDHLVPGIRMGGLRRGLALDIHVAPYGQWRQAILDPVALAAFEPDAVLLALDEEALLPRLPLAAGDEEVNGAIDAAVEELANHWRTLRDRYRVSVIQQTLSPATLPLFGHFERLVPAAPGAMCGRFNERLAVAAMRENVVLLDVYAAAANVGMRHIADPALWHHAKQAISPAATPWAGDQIGRILAALRGLSKKVLVLDLDNTLWGGVIGDDGVDGIVLGQGSGTGEAYLAFQTYAKRLAERGILLAVSSKNDLAVAEAAFDDHPEMVLRRSDFAAFEADWNDKPSAVRRIAHDLELGLDSLVFFDDNPAERALMRRTLPAVAVPEVPDAPELYARCLADAGYFESVSFTREDLARTGQYAANRERRRLESAATDMESFLRDLEMVLTVGPFRTPDIGRIAQLINKTNQFNLTTRRRTEAEVRALMEDRSVLTFAARLADRFGDNGLTTIVIGRFLPDAPSTLELDTWLMSCRILGRRVEDAMLTIVAEAATAAGADTLIGRYRPTLKNVMVKDFYSKLGFQPANADSGDGGSTWVLPLGNASLPDTGHLSIIHQG